MFWNAILRLIMSKKNQNKSALMARLIISVLMINDYAKNVARNILRSSVPPSIVQPMNACMNAVLCWLSCDQTAVVKELYEKRKKQIAKKITGGKKIEPFWNIDGIPNAISHIHFIKHTAHNELTECKKRRSNGDSDLIIDLALIIVFLCCGCFVSLFFLI